MAFKAVRVKLSYNTRQDGTKFIIIRYGGAKCQTQLLVRPEDWSDDNSMVLSTDRNYKRKNALLLDLVSRLESEVAGRNIGDKEFMRMYERITTGKEEVPKTFMECWMEYESTIAKSGTLKTFTNARSKIKEYREPLSFDTFNVGWLTRFNAWLLDKGYAINYISIIMRCIRKVNNYCIDCEYTDVYPFRRFQIRQEDTVKRNLTRKQLAVLRDYPVEEHQRKYRDCFMLSFYLIGMNLADIFDLKKENVVNGRIQYRRAKTSTLYNIKIEPEAQAIIDANKGTEHLLSWADEWKHNNFLWRMNRELQKIGPWERKPGRGGKKEFSPLFPGLSTYWARHTWATVASELGIPIDVIGRALGHSDQSHAVTNIYVDFDLKKIDKANRKVLDSLITRE